MQFLFVLVCLAILESALSWKGRHSSSSSSASSTSRWTKTTSTTDGSTLSISELEEQSSDTSTSSDSHASKLIKALKDARSRDKDKFEALKWKLRAANQRIAEAKAKDPFLNVKQASVDASTTSYDTSSNTRIAKAVESALLRAEEQSLPPRIPYNKFRLRLSTTNQVNSCTFFQCTELSSFPLTLDNVGVTVVTTDGTFMSKFEGYTATAVNDMFQWTLTFTPPSQFSFSTIVGDFGVNVTSIQLSTQEPGEGSAGQHYFQASESFGGGFDDETLLDEAEFAVAAPGQGSFGCDADFSGFARDGSNTVTISTNGGGRLGLNLLVANLTGNTTFDFELGVQELLLADADERELFNNIGLANFPCLTRQAIVYDDITVVTRRNGNTPSTDETLEHPCLYDALQQGTGSDFTNFVQELRLAAGRTQIRLRDVTIDAGAFSFLSRKSKFTPCFRVWPDDDYRIEAYFSMRGSSGQIVRAVSEADNGGFSNFVDDGEVIETVDDLPADNRPKFIVKEIDFSDLANTGNTDRPYTSYRSDVSVTVEDCPDFSYFQ